MESSPESSSEARESLRGIEQSISDKKSLRKVVNDYRRTRPTIDAHKKLSGRKAENYRQSHEAEFIIYEAALRQLKVLAPGKKLPATSKLNTEIEASFPRKTQLTTPTAPQKPSMSSLPPPNGTQSRYYTAHRADRKSMNRSVKNRPEMIPKPYKRQGVCHTLSAIPLTFPTGLTGRFFPKMAPEHTDFAPVPSYPTKPKKGAFFHAENEQEAAAGMGVLPQ